MGDSIKTPYSVDVYLNGKKVEKKNYEISLEKEELFKELFYLLLEIKLLKIL